MLGIQPLRESTIRDFFLGATTAAKLDEQAAGCVENIDSVTQDVHLNRDVDADFPLDRGCLIKLCDAVLNGELSPTSLATIAFALHATDRFVWDGDQDDTLAAIVDDWASPELFYPLTPHNLERCRRWLLGTEPYPQTPDTPGASGTGRLISRRVARYHE
jgi:hypothetical protein